MQGAPGALQGPRAGEPASFLSRAGYCTPIKPERPRHVRYCRVFRLVPCIDRSCMPLFPSQVHLMDKLPTTGSGKVLKTRLREMFSSAPAAPAPAPPPAPTPRLPSQPAPSTSFSNLSISAPPGALPPAPSARPPTPRLRPTPAFTQAAIAAFPGMPRLELHAASDPTATYLLVVPHTGTGNQGSGADSRGNGAEAPAYEAAAASSLLRALYGGARRLVVLHPGQPSQQLLHDIRAAVQLYGNPELQAANRPSPGVHVVSVDPSACMRDPRVARYAVLSALSKSSTTAAQPSPLVAMLLAEPGGEHERQQRRLDALALMREYDVYRAVRQAVPSLPVVPAYTPTGERRALPSDALLLVMAAPTAGERGVRASSTGPVARAVAAAMAAGAQRMLMVALGGEEDTAEADVQAAQASAAAASAVVRVVELPTRKPNSEAAPEEVARVWRYALLSAASAMSCGPISAILFPAPGPLQRSPEQLQSSPLPQPITTRQHLSPAPQIPQQLRYPPPAAPPAALVQPVLPYAAAPAQQQGAALAPAAIADVVAAVVTELLGTASPPAGTTPLTAAGLNSGAAVQLVSRLEDRLGLQLPPTLAFDYPTLDDVTTFLVQQQQQALPDASPAAPPASAPLPFPTYGHYGPGPSFPVPIYATAPANATGFSPASGSVVGRVMDVVREVLGLAPGQQQPPLEPGTPLMSAGVNSAAAVALTSALERSFGAQLPPTLVFDYPTAGDIADFLASIAPAGAVPATAAAGTSGMAWAQLQQMQQQQQQQAWQLSSAVRAGAASTKSIPAAASVAAAVRRAVEEVLGGGSSVGLTDDTPLMSAGEPAMSMLAYTKHVLHRLSGHRVYR